MPDNGYTVKAVISELADQKVYITQAMTIENLVDMYARCKS